MGRHERSGKFITMRIFLFGKDKAIWSIYYDRKYTEIFLKDLRHAVTANFLTADVIHSVWWNSLLSTRFYPLRWKKIIASATNEIDVSSSQFLRAKSFVNLWIAPSQAMYHRLKLAAVDVKYQPFYVDETVFSKVNRNKEEIAQELGLDHQSCTDKFVIGSFQRDSLGENLSRPKWQKGPELLIDILRRLPRDRFILLLAGPRRHWIINQCKKLAIPHFYYGKKPEGFKEDIHLNTLDKQTMNKLYNLADLYIVSSRSEGGPKAVLESSFAKTMILSTDVGLASDFLDPWCIYATLEEAVQKVEEIIEGKDTSEIIKYNYERAYSKASYKPVLNRWAQIYEYFKEAYLM